MDTDGAFVITREGIEESSRVMTFEKFKKIIEGLAKVGKNEKD